MAYVELRGHPTWYQPAKGRGKSVVLLHGGLSSSTSLWHSIGPGLRKHFRVSAFDRRGHGRSADTDQPFSIDAMAEETVAFLEHLGTRSHLVGHSDGANVALAVAMRRPDLVRRVVAVGGNFHYSGLMAMEPFTPQSPGFGDFAQDFAAKSPDGLAHAALVVEKTRVLIENEPNWTVDDLATISRPVLVMAGDDDVTTIAHVGAMFEAIPNAQLAILPGASHGVLKEHTQVATSMIVHFLKSTLPPVTRAPIRRKVAGE
ncbi:MAG: alpha/beta hydrolase [Acidobacteriota bacterium]|nr:alpha/beta hydrolase [Acidobacteriota bacterium]